MINVRIDRLGGVVRHLSFTGHASPSPLSTELDPHRVCAAVSVLAFTLSRMFPTRCSVESGDFEWENEGTFPPPNISEMESVEFVVRALGLLEESYPTHVRVVTRVRK